LALARSASHRRNKRTDTHHHRVADARFDGVDNATIQGDLLRQGEEADGGHGVDFLFPTERKDKGLAPLAHLVLVK
jgi:hypothetical protein